MFACSLLNVRNRVSHEKIEVLNRRRAAGSSNIRAFQILTALAVFLAINVLADAPRERLLLDSGWRFQPGDPGATGDRPRARRVRGRRSCASGGVGTRRIS